MTIYRPHLFSFFQTEKASVTKHRHLYDEAKENLEFASKIKTEINESLTQNYDFNWENDPRRELLDKLYQLDEFKDFEPSYHFTDPQKALELIQRVEHYHSSCVQNVELKKNMYVQKQSTLNERYNELLDIIRKLGSIMASLSG